ncbi:hypothetical protein FE782_12465 [Paenibacillus antri]|uniref:DUF5658 domain-containing protein n=1 Tax=Paenibacillus antri TaxID=2582848 RepID=A0A5R9G6X4_9BACL|nr:hypothetical protein [Paenibacillus antri]TLS52162.1 hypothetical protein FE782_12465 [Paenibacillus antri]
MSKSKHPVVSPIVSMLLSALASSHHWLHMTVLFILGNAANTMSTMQNMLWLRRSMIVMTLIIVVFTAYRLIKHHCTNKIVITINVISILVSLGFVLYTLLAFGW